MVLGIELAASGNGVCSACRGGRSLWSLPVCPRFLGAKIQLDITSVLPVTRVADREAGVAPLGVLAQALAEGRQIRN